MTNFSDHFKAVIQSEADSLRLAGENLPENLDSIIESIFQCTGRLIVTGMGKSGIVARKISATFSSTGTRSFFVHPGEAFHGDLGMVDPQDMILAISQSGETEELVRLLPFFTHNGNQIVAITGALESTLAKNATYTLSSYVEQEACPLNLAPTNSSTVILALGDALAVSLMKKRDFKTEDFARFHPGGNLGYKLLTTAGDIAQRADLPIVKKEALMDHVIQVVSEGMLGCALVAESNDSHGYGLITDGDIRRLIHNSKDKFFNLKAGDVCTKNPKTISSDFNLVETEKAFQENQITILFVTDSKGEFVGVVQIHKI